MRFTAAITLSLLAIAEAGAGQAFYMPGLSNEQLLAKPKPDQQSALAKAVENAQGAQEKQCKNPAIAFLEKDSDGTGFWNVACENGGEYLVMFPGKANKAAVSLNCTVAREVAKLDCRTAKQIP